MRHEDLDRSRVRDHFYGAIEEDLAWLRLDWDGNVERQTTRMHLYDAALASLRRLGVVYACACTRRDIQDAVAAPQEASSVSGPDGTIYPGTCRSSNLEDTGRHALRLDVAKASALLSPDGGASKMTYAEIGSESPVTHAFQPLDLRASTGDIVLRRRDGVPSYHLSVVVDDAEQDVTHVTRGEDLAPATPIQVLLQKLLGLPTPTYRHHALVRDETGRRLAKRDDARAIRAYRAAGLTPGDVLSLAGVTGPDR